MKCVYTYSFCHPGGKESNHDRHVVQSASTISEETSFVEEHRNVFKLLQMVTNTLLRMQGIPIRKDCKKTSVNSSALGINYILLFSIKTAGLLWFCS